MLAYWDFPGMADTQIEDFLYINAACSPRPSCMDTPYNGHPSGEESVDGILVKEVEPEQWLMELGQPMTHFV